MPNQSMRAARTVGNLTASSKQNIQQSRSDPMNLQRVNTDDSSVFSGLASMHNDYDVESDENKSVRSVRFDDTVPLVKQGKGGPTRTKWKEQKRRGVDKYSSRSLRSLTTENISEDEETKEEFTSIVRDEDAPTDSHRGALRNLRPVADYDSAFMDDNESCTMHGYSVTEHPYEQDASTCLGQDASTFFNHDGSTLSYASVNEFQRPRGKIRLLSDIQVLRSIDSNNSSQDDKEGPEYPPTPEGAEVISNILKDFGRELDENISNLTEKKDYDSQGLSEWQDVAPRRVLSDDDHQTLSSRQSKQLQAVLHQVRREVVVLRDNNEQFMSEIEQMEEEHKSEKKLYDERIKQKMFDLKAIYQQEMDALVLEKDAAIAAAGLQAAQYAECGRQQIASLKNQIETLKIHANVALKNAVRDTVMIVTRKKEEEIKIRLNAIRKSYESEMETARNETDEKIRCAVEDAIANASQSLSEERKSLETELNVDAIKRENALLQSKQEAMIMALQSVKENLNKHYAEQMESLRFKSRKDPNPLASIRSGHGNEFCLETLFREVVESFAYLIEQSEAKVAAAQEEIMAEKSKKERNEIYIQARQDLMTKHRAELEYARKQNEETKRKNERLECEFRVITKEKRALQERFRRDADSRRQEIQRLQEKVVELQKNQRQDNPFTAARDRRKAREAHGRNVCHDICTNTNVHSADNGHEDDQHVPPMKSEDPPTPLRSQATIDESGDDVEKMRNPNKLPLYDFQISTQCDERSPSNCNGSISHNDNEDRQESSSQSSPVDNGPKSLEPLLSQAEEPKEKNRDDPGALLAFSDDQNNSIKHTSIEIEIETSESYSDIQAVNETTRTRDDEQRLINKKREPLGFKEECIAPVCLHDAAKKKSFGILRGFKASRAELPMVTRDSDSSTTRQELDGRVELSQLPKNKAGAVNKILNFFDTMGKNESMHLRRDHFTCESTPALKIGYGCSSPRSKSMRATRSVNVTIGGSQSLDDDSENLLRNATESTSEHTRLRIRKKKKTLRYARK